MVIDHIGIVVKSIETSIEHWENVFKYRKMTDVVINSRQKVKVVFLCKKNSLTIKLVEPIDESSPVYKFALKGGGMHHICFKCKDMNKELQRLAEMGLRILTEPQPGEAFENENIAFIFAKNGLNIELIETDKKAKRLFLCDDTL
ncbi:MAG: VOC family protein [Candidatus Scalindua sp.]